MPLVRASHLQPTLAVTAIATALALSAGRRSGVVWVALAVLAGQLSVGWSNDYVDRHRDRLAGRSDKPIPAGEVPARVVGWGAVVALALCVPLSLLSGWWAGTVHLVAVGAALSYNLGLKSTIASPLPYLVAFGALPAFITLGLEGSPPPPAWAVAAGALLGAGAHFVNTLADREDDARTGVRGLPQRMPATAALLIGVAAMTAAAVVTTLAPSGAPGVVGSGFLVAAVVAAATVLLAVTVGHRRAAWSLTLAVAGLTVGGLVAGGGTLTA